MYTEPNAKEEILNKIDYANIVYSPNSRWSFALGKQFAGIGSYEFDLAPNDLYFGTSFFYNIDGFTLGIQANYISTSKKHNIGLQVTNSLFESDNISDMYSYAVVWYGNLKWFSTIYSVNFIEYKKGEFFNYVVLGHNFEFGTFSTKIDILGKTAVGRSKFFKDISLINTNTYKISDSWSIFIKFAYDNYSLESKKNLDPLPSKDIIYGAGFEYYPLKKKNQKLRFHAFYNSSDINPRVSTFNLGVNWNMDILKIDRK